MRIRLMMLSAVVLGMTFLFGHLTLAQAATTGNGGGPLGRFGMRMAQQLNLSPEQQAQARSIFENARARAMEVLTPEQRAQVQQRRSGKQGQRHESLNLTDAQKAQIQAIRTQMRKERDAIRSNTTLTTAQRQEQLQALRAANRARMQQVLTPEQRAQCEENRGARQGGGKLASSLTPEQRTRLQSIRTESRAAFRAILTPEQQAQFDSMCARDGMNPGGQPRQRGGMGGHQMRR